MHTVSEMKNLDLKHTDIAKSVKKVGVPAGQDPHPSPKAIQLLRRQFDEDPDWYPGKGFATGKRPGPKPLFTPQKRRCVAECAMAMARRGEEVTVGAVQARAPRACTNPGTGDVFDKARILKVFRTMCHDGDPADKWDYYVCSHKTALEPRLLPLRLAWAKRALNWHADKGWYFRHCVWFDPCNTIIPKGPRAVFNQRQAGRGRKVWTSRGSRKDNGKLSASKQANKQKSASDERVWWFVVLTRGVVRLKVMDKDWQQTGYGMARFVDGLEGLLDQMLGADVAKPRWCITDKGPGFYNSLNGEIVEAYNTALVRNGFRPFAGVDASSQPADLADFFLHETVVAWVRKWFKKHPFKAVEDVQTNYNLFLDRLRECERHINATYAVESLCKDTVMRLETLRDKKGARMKF